MVPATRCRNGGGGIFAQISVRHQWAAETLTGVIVYTKIGGNPVFCLPQPAAPA